MFENVARVGALNLAEEDMQVERRRTANGGHYDAIVIGGGPAGAASAISLARRGRSVLVLERKRFPRFHIGESLLGHGAELLNKMGLLDKVASGGFVVKRGVELSKTDGSFRRIELAFQGEDRRHSTFQVERARFDKILLDAAKEAGAEVLEQTRVNNLLFDRDRLIGVEYEGNSGPRAATADFVVDASGRSGVIAHNLKLRRVDQTLRMVAIYKHFGNVNEENNPAARGDVQLGSHQDGWVWAIPIREDVMSVGVVTPVEVVRNSSPEEVFEAHHVRVPRIKERIAGAVPLRSVRGETDYCYYSDKLSGPGYFITGDAGCFVDPIFSGGVYLSMVTGLKAAEAIDNIVSGGGSEEQVQTYYDNFYKTGYDTYSRLIRAYFDYDYDIKSYYANVPGVEVKYVVRLLDGEFWDQHNPVARHLRSESAWDMFEPFEPVYDCPVYPEESAQAEGLYPEASGRGRTDLESEEDEASLSTAVKRGLTA